MIPAWWLCLIVPAAACFGLVLGGLLNAAGAERSYVKSAAMAEQIRRTPPPPKSLHFRDTEWRDRG